METFDLGDGHVLVNIHSKDQCAGSHCVIHSPTNHHMRSWSLIWRDDRGIFERIDPLGCGHPDPDQFDYWRETNQEWQIVHGCTGLCNKERWDEYVAAQTQ